jgi:hypothetical protein
MSRRQRQRREFPVLRGGPEDACRRVRDHPEHATGDGKGCVERREALTDHGACDRDGDKDRQP